MVHEFDIEQSVAAEVQQGIDQLFIAGSDTAFLSKQKVINVLTDVAVLSFQGCLAEVEDFVKAFQLLPSHPDYPGQYKAG